MAAPGLIAVEEAGAINPAGARGNRVRKLLHWHHASDAACVRLTVPLEQCPFCTLSLRVFSHHRLPRTEAEATGVSEPFGVQCVGCCAGNRCDTGESGSWRQLEQQSIYAFRRARSPRSKVLHCSTLLRSPPPLGPLCALHR